MPISGSEHPTHGRFLLFVLLSNEITIEMYRREQRNFDHSEENYAEQHEPVLEIGICTSLDQLDKGGICCEFSFDGRRRPF